MSQTHTLFAPILESTNQDGTEVGVCDATRKYLPALSVASSTRVCRIPASVSALGPGFPQRCHTHSIRGQQNANLFREFPRNLSEGESVKDINLVLRNKRVQLAELALEINGLEAAASALRPVVHLLFEEETPQGSTASHIALAEDSPSAIAEEARAIAPERSRVRRWV